MFNFSKLLPEKKLKEKRGCYHFFFSLWEKQKKTEKSSTASFRTHKMKYVYAERLILSDFSAEVFPAVLCMPCISQ